MASLLQGCLSNAHAGEMIRRKIQEDGIIDDADSS
jgi:hypothetical protein